MKIILAANTDWYLFNFRMTLAEDLRRSGHEVVLVSPPGKYTELMQASGFQWVEWDVSRKAMSPLGEFRAVSRLLKIYLTIKPDITHHSTMKPVLYGSIAARRAKVSGIVNSITGLGYIWLSSSRKAKALRPLMKLMFKNSLRGHKVRLIFENSSDQDFFIRERLVHSEQTVVIPGVGVDSDRFSPSPEPVGKPVILFPSRILWDKGVGDLIEAARILHKTHDIRIVLAGKPDPGNPTSVDENTIHIWVKEGLVEYWGWMEDMAQVYHQSQIVTLPSLYEGVPTALLEAASCERPIVATDVPGCRAIIRDGVNGFLVPVHNPQALADALGKLLQDASLRHKMGKAGRKIILEEFAVQIVNQRTIAVYNEMVKPDNQNHNNPIG